MQPDHTLKIDPNQYKAIAFGKKKHEVRRFDREFKEGQIIQLNEFDRQTHQYSGRQLLVRIQDITAPGTYELPSDIGVFSINVISKYHA